MNAKMYVLKVCFVSAMVMAVVMWAQTGFSCQQES
jgi:hypothetical protein